MSSLEAYKLHYEDITPSARKGGKDSKMSKSNKPVEATPAKTYNKTKGEHFKDMVIVALVVGIIAFGLGFKFNADRNAEMQSAVRQATTQVSQSEVKK
jgi:hypothetical protein